MASQKLTSIDSVEQKNMLLEMLKYIDDFCARYEIKYFLAYGTLLGAVRHRGFIPWDDDIDIWMFRKDYERFIELFSKSEKKQYFISSCKNRNTNVPFCKVIDSYTYIRDKGKLVNGLFIDVFPLDNCPNKEKTIHYYNKRVKKYQSLLYIEEIKLEKIFKKIIRNILFFLPTNAIIKTIDKRAQFFRETNDKYVCNFMVAKYIDNGFFDKNIFNETMLMDFENLKLPVPSKHKTLLSQIYGNWEELTPCRKNQSSYTGMLC